VIRLLPAVVSVMWHDLTDPPTSTEAWLVRNLALPVVALYVIGCTLVVGRPGPLLNELVWLALVLSILRERDRTRVDLAAARRSAGGVQ
jgi:hypothetical protein